MEQLDAVADTAACGRAARRLGTAGRHRRARDKAATLTDAVCDGRFEGDEMRTVVRRLLSRVAAADPAIFRREGSRKQPQRQCAGSRAK